MRRCSKCHKEKVLSGFYKHKGMKDGYLNKCKECVKEEVRNNTTDYSKTQKGVIRILYKSMKRRSKLKGYNFTINKEEFRTWAYANGILKLYKAWVESGHQKKLKPSVDRINDYNGYFFDNMRLVTDAENRQKQYEDIRLGRSTSGARCKPVLCFNKDGGSLVARYVSISSAKRAVGYSFEKVVNRGKADRGHGFIWYHEDYFNSRQRS